MLQHMYIEIAHISYTYVSAIPTLDIQTCLVFWECFYFYLIESKYRSCDATAQKKSLAAIKFLFRTKSRNQFLFVLVLHRSKSFNFYSGCLIPIDNCIFVFNREKNMATERRERKKRRRNQLFFFDFDFQKNRSQPECARACSSLSLLVIPDELSVFCIVSDSTNKKKGGHLI